MPNWNKIHSQQYAASAQQRKMIFDGIMQAASANEERWESVQKGDHHWTELAEPIRLGHALASQASEAFFDFADHWIAAESAATRFGRQQKTAEMIKEAQTIQDDLKYIITVWEERAREYGVGLISQQDDVEIALLADAALLDIYKYRGSKWDGAETAELISKVRKQYEISDDQYSAWALIRGVRD